MFRALERPQVMTLDKASEPSTELLRRILTDCFSPVSPRAIDRYTDSPWVRSLYGAVVDSFPDACFAPLWSVVDSERAVVGGQVRATHQGEWRGIAPTGRPVEVLATVMLELSDEGVVDLMVVTDSLTMAEQLGAIEPLGAKVCATLPAAPGHGPTPCGDALFSSFGP